MKYLLLSLIVITAHAAEHTKSGIAFIEKYITTYNHDPQIAYLMWADDATVEMKLVDEKGTVVKSGIVPISVVIQNSIKAMESGKRDTLSIVNLTQESVNDTIIVSGNRPTGETKRSISFTLVKYGETFKIIKNVVEMGAPNRK